MAKWWLLSDRDMKAIRAYLQVRADAGDEAARAALHTLDSGLNTTDAIPDDWKKDRQSA